MYTYTGTVAYTAPEVFCIKKYQKYSLFFHIRNWILRPIRRYVVNRRYFSFFSIIFIVVLYTMLSGHEPFEAEYLKDLVEKIKKGDFEFPGESWDNVSESAKDLVTNLLQKEPSKRMTAD